MMKDFLTNEIRNVCVLGNGNAGKTTVVESMLKFADCIERRGSVLDGTTVSDYDPEEIKRVFGDSTTLDFIQYYKDGFDVVVKGNNKGDGVKHLAEVTGTDLSEIMVFGDNYNDVEMFEVAGIKIAMGNAVDVIKDMATYITDDCSSDGIYNACKHFNLF